MMWTVYPLAVRSLPFTAYHLALALCFSFTLLMGEFALFFWRLYPLERAHRGLTFSRGEYLRLRMGLVFETVAPMVAAGLIVLTVIDVLRDEASKSAGERLLIGFMGIVGVALGVLYTRRGLMLPVRSLSIAQPLQEEVQRMGRELGIQVRELLVLDGTRARMANAFALGSGRIAITDYLLANLTEREALAVLAHEVAHLAQRRRLWRLWLLELGAASGLVMGLAPFWQQLPAWSHILLMIVLMASMVAPIVWLRRWHELQADTFAASHYGAEAMQSALLKVAAMHGVPCKGMTGVHPSLQQRLAHLQQLTLR